MLSSKIISNDDSVIWGDEDKICIVTVARRTLGEEVATLLKIHFGGAEIHVPVKMPPDHALAKLIGWEPACILAAEVGGTNKCFVSRGEFSPAVMVRRVVRWCTFGGVPMRVAGALAGVSERHARYVAAQLRAANLLPSGSWKNQHGTCHP